MKLRTLFLFVQTGVFSGTVAVDHDYIRVDVVTSSGKTIGDVHMHVFPKKEVLERPQKAGGIPLNVALVMFDSTSAANFKRKMPNSLEYLTKNLNSVFMQGEFIKCFILVTCLILFQTASVYTSLKAKRPTRDVPSMSVLRWLKTV